MTAHVCHTCGCAITTGMMIRIGPRTAQALGLGDEPLYTHPLDCRLPIEHAVERMRPLYDDDRLAACILDDRMYVTWTTT